MSAKSFGIKKGDGIGGEGITLVPKSGEYKNVVVWLHGLGDTAAGWSSSVPEFAIPNTKYILPTAAKRSITLNAGSIMPAWSDIKGLDRDSEEDRAGFDESAGRIQSIMASEKAKGTEYSRMVVGGFSQGGATAFHFCLRSTEALAGCIGCSSWVPMNKDYPEALGSGAKSLRVCQFHGTRDQVVQFNWGQRSHILLKGMLDVAPTLTPMPKMGHEVCVEELEGIQEFLAEVLPS